MRSYQDRMKDMWEEAKRLKEEIEEMDRKYKEELRTK